METSPTRLRLQATPAPDRETGQAAGQRRQPPQGSARRLGQEGRVSTFRSAPSSLPCSARSEGLAAVQETRPTPFRADGSAGDREIALAFQNPSVARTTVAAHRRFDPRIWRRSLAAALWPPSQTQFHMANQAILTWSKGSAFRLWTWPPGWPAGRPSEGRAALRRGEILPLAQAFLSAAPRTERPRTPGSLLMDEDTWQWIRRGDAVAGPLGKLRQGRL